jgi:hypothetical protein
MTEFDDDCKGAWDALKSTLAEAPIRLLPDFTKPFLLYTNGSKEFGFGPALHQVDENGKERPVLFFFPRNCLWPNKTTGQRS